ncbi:hypothetical protein TIN4_72 [Tsukamurella phage TIN4]|uniref:Uncharacterized protein n=2 Tax=Tinduovirus TIN3 TaxID=1982571 RepID=A0A0K0N648_9CAUD|nr:hypothetical protein AVT54_gp053 [Tsukamurella phage TIN3]YP_009604202.1 hypothetical protein FDH87_gp053 [Tsukamurella phage TIN4]AKJ71869.1 hypothetical protein TIN3_72 [Tsukamurella phage TIN3]AKJ71978.1 hypothetical protein TIN4_72 [Tsukamurella phage TIN4]
MTVTKMKRVNHSNCTHPATSHERAKCRMRKELEADRASSGGEKVDITPNALGESITRAFGVSRPLADVAKQLSEAIQARDTIESRLTSHEQTVRSLQEELAESMLSREPINDTNGNSPIVAFNKVFRDNKVYEYVAIGIEVRVNQFENDQFTQREVFRKRMWFLSCGSGNTASPKTWSDLVKFMGVDGLRSLQVLRAG